MHFYEKPKQLADIICPVCSTLSFYSSDFPGSYFICEKCGWEDDDVQFDDPNYAGGANDISLNQARIEYKLLSPRAHKSKLP
tara:strand:+ start:2225 stop:2470 length:246 start_codon:yes stop_codon:yes gene_type:complete